MKIVQPSFVIEYPDPLDGEKILQHLERCGRTCYKSEAISTPESSRKMVADLLKRGHESVLEHASISVRVICDRGVSHEIVRHRIASYSQESTRYCNYGKEKFGNEIMVISPSFFEKQDPEISVERFVKRYLIWKSAMESAERSYMDLIAEGCSAQEARTVLPNSLKTEIVMSMNLREWRHFFKLRAAGTSGKPHPQMKEIAAPMLAEFKRLIPVVFDDIVAA
jgi:thymidylate synthase (FAD)